MHHQSLTEWPWFHRCNTESEWYQIHENIIKKLNARYNLTGSNAGEYKVCLTPHTLYFSCFALFVCEEDLQPFVFLCSLPKSARSACWYVSLLYDRFVTITLKDLFFSGLNQDKSILVYSLVLGSPGCCWLVKTKWQIYLSSWQLCGMGLMNRNFCQ